MISPAEHIGKAHRLLASGAYLLSGGFSDDAGRSAYLAGFPAALAFIVSRTGKEPKTHSGTHSEFARLAREEPRIDPGYQRFLANAYKLKTWADYDGDKPVQRNEAETALATATELVGLIEGLLPPT